MGGRDGHVLLGLVFCIVGLWHIYNNVKDYVKRKTFISLQWYPTSFSRYCELYLIMLGCSIFTFVEIRLAPLDSDGTIKASKLHHLEHACIATAFFLHALFAILLDKIQPKPKSHIDIGHFIVAMAFVIELLLFHFHTTDHIGLEGQYHWLLQNVVLVCLITTLLSIWLPKSFMACFIRSLFVIFQGLWLIVMGYMLWTPEFAPKGCSVERDDYGRDVIKCDHDEEALHRGKALVNILFTWFLIGIMSFGVGLYVIVNKVHGENGFMEVDGEEGSLELEDRQGFLYDKRVLPIDLEK